MGARRSFGGRLADAAVVVLLFAAGCSSDGGSAKTEAGVGSETPAPIAASPEATAAAASEAAATTGLAPARGAPAVEPGSKPGGGSTSVAAAAGPSTKATSRPASSVAPSGVGAVTPAGAGGAQNSKAPAPSGDQAAPGTATPAGPSSSSAGPKAEIRLASLGVATGPLGAVIRPIPDAARAWAASVNARGGLGGHPIKLVVGDDGGDPGRALALAKQFVERDKVHAFFGTHMITTEEAITPYLDQKQVPIIGTCNCSAGNDISPMVFFFGPSASKGLAWSHLAGFYELTKLRKVAFVYCREAQQCKGAADAAKPMAEAVGFELVYSAQVSLAAPDYTAEAIAARNAGAEAVAVFADNQTAVRFIRSAARQSWKPAVSVQQSGYDERMLETKDTEGMFTSAIVPDFFTDPRLAEYRTAIQKVPDAVRATIGAGTFVVGQLLEKYSGELPNNPTSADFLRLMYSLRGETMGGLLPPITFRPGKPHEDTNRCVIPAQVRGGKFVTPTGDRFSCAPGWKPIEL